MKRTNLFAWSLVVIAATGAMVLGLSRLRRRRMRQSVSNEGYETAADMLYPRRRPARDEHYGPVLP